MSTSAMQTPFVSVIIPVFNDAARLPLCLKALAVQTYPQPHYEIIVIDNNSDESTQPLVEGFARARWTHEPEPSSYAARNKGLSLANGDVLAFTDSDCIPAPDWIERGVATLLRTPDCGLAAGQVEIFFEDTDRPTAIELYESVMALTQKNYVERHSFGATANLFTRASIFAHVGLFNASLKSGGDREWGRRVAAHGYKLVYAEDARVAHPARRSFGELRSKIVRVIGGLRDLESQEGEKRTVAGVMGKFVVNCAGVMKYSLRAASSRKLKTARSKTRVIGVVCFVKFVQTREELRLFLRGRLGA